jgi:hypothetical protein
MSRIARVKTNDPRARRNWNALSQKLDDIFLNDPFDLQDGKLALNLGNGLELSAPNLQAVAGSLVSVDSDGINALPTAAFFFGGTGTENAVRRAKAAADDAELQSRSFAWFIS